MGAGPTGSWKVIGTEQLSYTLSGFDCPISLGLAIKKARPAASRNGTLFCFRTGRGGLDLEAVEMPGWQELGREYRVRQPYYRG